jgi:hypothetical protein
MEQYSAWVTFPKTLKSEIADKLTNRSGQEA